MTTAQQSADKEDIPLSQSIILKLYPGMDISADGIVSFYASMRGVHLALLPNLGMAVLEVPAGWDLEMLAEVLQQDPAVQQAVMDTSRITVEDANSRRVPNDPMAFG